MSGSVIQYLTVVYHAQFFQILLLGIAIQFLPCGPFFFPLSLFPWSIRFELFNQLFNKANTTKGKQVTTIAGYSQDGTHVLTYKMT